MSQALLDAFLNAQPMTLRVNAIAAASAALSTATSERDTILTLIHDRLAMAVGAAPTVANVTLSDVKVAIDTASRLLKSLSRQTQQQVFDLATNNLGAPLRDELVRDTDLNAAIANHRAGNSVATPAAPTSPITLLDAMKPVLNSALTSATNGKITDIQPLIAAFVNQATIHQRVTEKEALLQTKDSELQQVQLEMSQLRVQLAGMASRPALPTNLPADGAMPGCKIVKKKAAEVFFPGKRVSSLLNIEVTCLEWDAPNPYLPQVDPFYEFNVEHLARAMIAFEKGHRVVTTGHTGTGKTSFYEQVAARLGFLFERINLDSEIGRLDLVGRDKLVTDPHGKTVSDFIDGVLVKAIQKPCILDLDEVDFIRPDVIPIFYRATERAGELLINEDGGRLVKPHPLCRLGIACNTKLAGDESGAYVGTKAQPLALRNRFSTWIEMDYLPPEQEARVIKNKAPGVTDDVVKRLLTLAKMVRDAFREGKIIDVMTPRDLIAIAEYDVEVRAATNQKNNDPLLFAITSGFLGRLVSQDKQVVTEFVTRVVA